MQTNDNTKGILFIMTGMAFFSIQDSLIKFIFEDIALFESVSYTHLRAHETV